MAEELALSLSLSVGLCAGLPTTAWCLLSLRRQRQAGGHISFFVASLLVSNMLEMALSPFVNTRLLERRPCLHHRLPCWPLYSAFAEERLCGLHFHQLVALEGVLAAHYRTVTSNFWGTFLTLTVTLSLWVVVISSNFFGFYGYVVNLLLCSLPVVLAVTTTMLTLKVLVSSDGPPVCKRSGLKVLAAALAIFLVLYLPCLVIGCVSFPKPFFDSDWATVAVSVMSLRVVVEPLFCVLVVGEIVKNQSPHSHPAVPHTQESD